MNHLEFGIKMARNKVLGSDLWQRCIENRLSEDDRYLLATLLKRVCKLEEKVGLLVFTEKKYLDTDQDDWGW